MVEYTEGIAEDGAAILADGQPMTVSEVLDQLNWTSERITELVRAAYMEGWNDGFWDVEMATDEEGWMHSTVREAVEE